MINPLRNFNIYNNTGIQDRNKKCSIPLNIYSKDSICFRANLCKLSNDKITLVQDFAQKLKLNKVYKFERPNIEKFQMISIASPSNAEKRILLVNYSGYSKNNTTKHITCTINEHGEIFERDTRVKNKNEINIYGDIITSLINIASKELKIKY